jgi:hypothetical protein
MSAVGEWTLHYDWGNSQDFALTPVSLKSSGAFTGPESGAWRQQDGTILLSFDGGPAKYGGRVDANVASGAMTTFNGLAGSWYMLRQSGGSVAQATQSSPNAAGGES